MPARFSPPCFAAATAAFADFRPRPAVARGAWRWNAGRSSSSPTRRTIRASSSRCGCSRTGPTTSPNARSSSSPTPTPPPTAAAPATPPARVRSGPDRHRRQHRPAPPGCRPAREIINLIDRTPPPRGNGGPSRRPDATVPRLTARHATQPTARRAPLTKGSRCDFRFLTGAALMLALPAPRQRVRPMEQPAPDRSAREIETQSIRALLPPDRLIGKMTAYWDIIFLSGDSSRPQRRALIQ